jgi:hypothetical protein
MDTFITKPYLQQLSTWPSEGRHIMAHYDETSIIVYQAYRADIAQHAVEHQRFGGAFSYTRMSWIKPNFLWMMFRCGWASKPGQEHVLAIRLPRAFFDELLHQAVISTFDAAQYQSMEAWQAAVKKSDVRLQWDPDHDPIGKSLARRAVQLGLRGEALRRYGQIAPLSIEDITEFVREQSANAKPPFASLHIPEEKEYIITQKEF